MEMNFTPIPFWFWNDQLEENEIERQMLEMKAKGVEGFVIHPRKGLPKTIEYMGETYLNFVEFAVKKAANFKMIAVLYDEAMYPSGSAHGAVVEENPDFASKGLNADFEIVPSLGTIRGVHEGEDDGEENAPKSADLLNPLAVQSFIRHTHEKYYERLKPYFGTTIKAIFTDEPCILGRNPKKGLIPWTDDLMEDLKLAGFEEGWLKFLFEDDKSSISAKANKIYKKAIHDRMATAYYGQLRQWCDAHGIGLMGHPEKSTDIGYMKYFTYPCQDIVWRFVAPEKEKYIKGQHSCMAKCSSDAARHRNILRNGNECFGVCGHLDDPYAFEEKDMLWYLNWLFVRGVNLIIPHAFYYSIRDGRGDERPPEVGMHNPFWPEYRKMSDYIKYMCSLNAGSANQAKVAVLCSYDIMSDEIARPLFENQIEFNYLEEELLPECHIENGYVRIAQQEYSTIIFDKTFQENMATETAIYLEKMQKAGVSLITYKDYDTLLEQVEADREIRLVPSQKDIRVTHLKKEKNDFLILTNEGSDPARFELSITGKRISYLENPYNCKKTDFANPEDEISIEIQPCESRIIYIQN